MKTLLHCPDPGRANVICSRLGSEGITAEVVNENTATISLCPALENEGIRILVDEADFDRAAAIVESVYAVRPVSCPRCGSCDTQVADASDINPLTETIRRIFHGQRQKYLCHTCNRTFYKEG